MKKPANDLPKRLKAALTTPADLEGAEALDLLKDIRAALLEAFRMVPPAPYAVTLESVVNTMRGHFASGGHPAVITLAEFLTPRARMTAPGAYVLRDFGPGAHQRYVTHWRNDERPEQAGYGSGHYFADLGAAVDDYNARVARHVRMYGDPADPAALAAHADLSEKLDA